MRWMLRSIGLVNIVVLARLLMPSDLGLVAMAVLVIAFANNFTQMGAQQLLIRQRDIDRDAIDAAWTIHILQGLFVGVLVLLAAPAAGSYFGDPRVESILRVLALVPLIRGFRNIGLTLARRDLDFYPDFLAQVMSKLAEFVITLVLVLWLRSYWALVIGSVLGAIGAVAISYRLHSYRPRICCRNLGPYFRFAAAIVPLRIARFGNTRGGVVVAAGMATSSQFGLFNIAVVVTDMLGKELVAPLSRGVFPGYSRLGSDRGLLARVFVEMLNVSASLLLPAGIGLALVADDFVVTILGPRWLESVTYIQWFAFAGAIAGINHMMNFHILIAAGHEARAAATAWARLILFIPSVIAAGTLGGGLLAIARITLVFELLFLPISILVLVRSIPVSVWQLAAGLLRPLLSAMAMAVAVVCLYSLEFDDAGIRLLLAVSLGMVSYGVSLYVIWRLCGCPVGAEALLVKYLRREEVGLSELRRIG